MTLTTEVKKLADSKPVHAVAGAGDLAVARIRELPERLSKLRERQTELRDLRERARGYASDLSERVNEIYDDLANRGKEVVERIQGSEATKQLEDQVKATQRKAAEVTGSAKKTAKAAGKAASDAASKTGK